MEINLGAAHGGGGRRSGGGHAVAHHVAAFHGGHAFRGTRGNFRGSHFGHTGHGWGAHHEHFAQRLFGRGYGALTARQQYWANLAAQQAALQSAQGGGGGGSAPGGEGSDAGSPDSGGGDQGMLEKILQMLQQLVPQGAQGAQPQAGGSGPVSGAMVDSGGMSGLGAFEHRGGFGHESGHEAIHPAALRFDGGHGFAHPGGFHPVNIAHVGMSREGFRHEGGFRPGYRREGWQTGERGAGYAPWMANDGWQWFEGRWRRWDWSRSRWQYKDAA